MEEVSWIAGTLGMAELKLGEGFVEEMTAGTECGCDLRKKGTIEILEAKDEIEGIWWQDGGFQIRLDQDDAGNVRGNGGERNTEDGKIVRSGESGGAFEGRGREIDGDDRPAMFGEEDGVLGGAASEVEGARGGMWTREKRKTFEEKGRGSGNVGLRLAVAGVPGLEVVGHVWRETRKPGEMITQRYAEKDGRMPTLPADECADRQD